MDKSIIKYDENDYAGCNINNMPGGKFQAESSKKEDPVNIHRMPKIIQPIHKDYGLWICAFSRNSQSQPRNVIQPRYFEFYNISHLIGGNGWFWSKSKGQIEKMLPGQCVMLSPGYVHFYGGDTAPYIEDTVCFSGRIADYLFKNGMISPGIKEMGKARRLLPIIELAIDPSPVSQLHACVELQKLLVEIHMENRNLKSREMYPHIKKLLEVLKDTPQKWWTVEEMAEYCNLSQAQFRKVFKSYAGMAPKLYLDKLKIQQASEMLSISEINISEIAKNFAYLDPFHFSRRFKEIKGISPEKYRENLLKQKK